MLALNDMHERLNNLVCGSRVVFHHVPKCGGTSVYRALRRRYFTSYAGFDIHAVYKTIEALNPSRDEVWTRNETLRFREEQLLHFLYNDIRCIAGHVRFSETAYERFSSRYSFVTTLREPVSLFVSTFFFNTTGKEARWRIDSDIESFLETPRAALFGASYAHFFSGLPPDCDPQSRMVIERAKANLARFAVIGLTDDMARFEHRLRDLLGVRIRIGHQNKARIGKGERDRVITGGVRKKIEAISAVNLEIYDYVSRSLAR